MTNRSGKSDNFETAGSWRRYAKENHQREQQLLEEKLAGFSHFERAVIEGIQKYGQGYSVTFECCPEEYFHYDGYYYTCTQEVLGAYGVRYIWSREETDK